jgi:hypothetical protein
MDVLGDMKFTVRFTIDITDLTSTVEEAIILAKDMVAEGMILEDVQVTEHTEREGDLEHRVSYIDYALGE